ncbi:HK97 gp10 family phage protein [Sphingomonas xinjiangensis]|uniref:HK97 gp10 family phage protein n=1 Tax=Sphingomonas xinjiangensis TaxID=643568 RepID=A0A840YAM3_9SPHN|nr:HK97-gp10 family putative phage morphogenesis protein [Sphingomonas xinjiangensis]MBB5709345.1 HK97 gp10 family phage protein [Sphingomonas xinjiangensis]
MDSVVGKALFVAGESIAVEAQLSITRGAVSGKGHTPSSPGEAPNNDTGRLAGQIEVLQKSDKLVVVTSEAPHSTPLEFGTSRMAARPFMRPARDKMAPEAQRLVADAVDRFSRKSRG